MSLTGYSNVICARVINNNPFNPTRIIAHDTAYERKVPKKQGIIVRECLSEVKGEEEQDFEASGDQIVVQAAGEGRIVPETAAEEIVVSKTAASSTATLRTAGAIFPEVFPSFSCPSMSHEADQFEEIIRLSAEGATMVQNL